LGRIEGQVVGGDGGFERGEDEDLAAGVDLEDGSGAISDVEIAVAVEGDAGCDSHALGVGGDSALGRDAVDRPFGARACVEVAIGIEGEPGRVHQVADEGDHLEVALNAED
jgi:hypothetical protein